MKQTFFLGDRCLGSREVEEVWYPESRTNPPGAAFRHTNLALCCPVCGEIWGRVMYDRAMPNWLFETRRCGKHPDGELELAGWIEWRQGSFIHPFPEQPHPLNFSDDWPEEAVKWEFKVLLQKFNHQ